MSTTAPITPERKAQIDAYQSKLYRSSFAIRKELQPGLIHACEAAGARSISELLALLAESPDESGEALKPVFTAAAVRRGDRPTMKDALHEIKASDLTPEEILAAVQAARAAKEAGEANHE